jgi:hypothetical protein
LEELLVDGIEKILLFGEVSEVGASALDGLVITIEFAEELRG